MGLKPFAAGLATTVSLVGGAVVAGELAGDVLGVAPWASSRPAAQTAEALELPQGFPTPRPGIDRPPFVLQALPQPVTELGAAVRLRRSGDALGPARDGAAAPRGASRSADASNAGRGSGDRAANTPDPAASAPQTSGTAPATGTEPESATAQPDLSASAGTAAPAAGQGGGGATEAAAGSGSVARAARVRLKVSTATIDTATTNSAVALRVAVSGQAEAGAGAVPEVLDLKVAVDPGTAAAALEQADGDAVALSTRIDLDRGADGAGGTDLRVRMKVLQGDEVPTAPVVREIEGEAAGLSDAVDVVVPLHRKDEDAGDTPGAPKPGDGGSAPSTGDDTGADVPAATEPVEVRIPVTGHGHKPDATEDVSVPVPPAADDQAPSGDAPDLAVSVSVNPTTADAPQAVEAGSTPVAVEALPEPTAPPADAEPAIAAVQPVAEAPVAEAEARTAEPRAADGAAEPAEQ